MPLRAFRAAETEVARVASAVLRNAPGPVALGRPPGTDVRALGVAAFAGGMGALLGHWCETGRVTAEAAVTELFASHLRHGRGRIVRLREGFERVLVALAERGVEGWVLKGMHTAYRYFPEPGARILADVDVLVRTEEWRAARDALRALGFVEDRSPTHPQQSSWTLPGAGTFHSLEYAHAEDPWAVDLHRSLDRTPFEGLSARLGSPDPAAGERWAEFCRPVRVLRPPLLLAYLALHASSHFYAIRQIWLVEIVLVARRDFEGRPDCWQAFDELVARTATGRFVFPALDLAERLVPGTIDARVLQRIATATPRRLRRLVSRMPPASAQRLHPFPGLRERFVWVATPREWLAALRWLLWPREGDRPASPSRAVVAQWRRIRRALRRVVHARTP